MQGLRRIARRPPVLGLLALAGVGGALAYYGDPGLDWYTDQISRAPFRHPE